MSAIRMLHRVVVPTDHPASIAYSNEGIWVADVEKAQLLLIDFKTGQPLRRCASIVKRPQTISWDGDYLWEYDEETSTLYKHHLDGGPSFLFGRVEGIHTPYYGLTHRGRTLWLLFPDQPEFTVSNNQITTIDFPRNIVSETYDAPTYSCRGLCHDGLYLWTLDVESSEVFALDPRRGAIITSYRLPEATSASSIVVTEDRIWTLNLRTNELLTYALDRHVQISFSGGRQSDIELVYTIGNNGPGVVRQLELFNSLPADYINQRMVRPVDISPLQDADLVSQWDEGEGKVALHVIEDLQPATERQIRLAFSIETSNVTWHLYPDRTGTLADVPEDIKNNYLISSLLTNPNPAIRDAVQKAQLLFQIGEREIRDKVSEIIGTEENPFWIARLIYDYVVDHIKYVLPYASLSSRKILKQGKGSCGNHATIFIAFCQVAGLPARSIIGFSIWKDDSRLGYLDHEIPQVYLPSYGWIPVDSSRFMSLPIYGTHPLTKFRSFGTLSDRFFVNGFGRDLRSPFAIKRHNEERLCRVDGPCDPDIRFFMRWQSRPIPENRRFTAEGDSPARSADGTV